MNHNSPNPLDLTGSSEEAIQSLQTEVEYLRQCLAASESRQRQRLAAMPQMIWIAAPDGSSTDFNPHWYEYTGLSVAESLGWGFLKAIHPEDRDRYLAQRQKALSQPDKIEYRLLGADGNYHWMLDQAAPVLQENGILEWVGTCTPKEQDPSSSEQKLALQITQLEAANQLTNEILASQHAAQVQAEAAKQSYRDLADAMPLIIWTAQPDGALYYYNQRWFDYTGMTLEQTQGWGWQPVLHPDDLQKCLDTWERSLKTGAPYEIEYRFKRAADSTYPWHLGRALATRDSDGKIVSWVGTCTDIDDRKQVEAALEASQTALKAHADELTCLMAGIAQINIALEKRNQELDQFAYVVSHDLKAPLRAIANLSQWIEEDISDSLNDENRHQMKLLRGRVHRLEALLNGLLQYSRVGRIATEAELVDVKALLYEVLNSIAPPPQVTITIGSEMPTLLTQRLPMFQVFSNLLSNAIKHHDRLDAQVTISVVDKDQFYEFAVTDDGPGIAPQYHEKVFGIFQTLKARDQVENTGVGLAIVKKIIDSFAGDIHLESQEGQGATFRFTWPKQPT